jgi:hypothetical protein
MRTLKQLCEPRQSVFDASRRDTVLNLTHLIEDRVRPEEFFEENFVTQGMNTLLEEAFRRLTGKSDQAIFKLTQAMGGGKTHNLMSLGLLAMHPQFRARVHSKLPDKAELGPVRVIAFSGRETDIPHGIWGEIARQLGREEFFKDYYSPLRAPGRTAWANLLKGGPLLILLDELPPYLDNAKATSVGNSDLARVTATALANLFEAVAEQELGQVCIVLTDLVGTYPGATAQIQAVLQQVQDEAQRRAMDLAPVQINSDEFYQIIRKRLFKTLPSDTQVAEVAQGYAKAIRDAKQMDITTESPEQFATKVQASYPLHPAVKDLYARFRENPGFQQTRALIRLMRIITSRLWDSGEADKRYLIAVQDLDLNDPETLSEIRQINPGLENAISHDIASQGGSVAEVMDQNLGNTDAGDACRVIFVASLANVPNAILGLSIPELAAYLCAPGRDITKLKGEVLEKLATAAWYLHSNRDGKLFFKNIENLNAKLESLAKAYVREQSLKELRDRLGKLFTPTTGWCYQTVLALPAIDEIQPMVDKITLVISEPVEGQGLNPTLRTFWEQTTYKNRVAFLTGARNTFDTLIESAKRLKAIQHIIDEMEADKVPASDPQAKQADDLRTRILGQFLSAVKETFSTVWYPTRRGNQDELASADFLMRYSSNEYNGEDQVIEIVKQKQKFTDDVGSETFRKKIEQRLFTNPVMLWSEVKKRAAINPQWQWHRRDALDAMKTEMVHKEVWREDAGGYVDRNPPPAAATSVQILERARNDETGDVELKVTPLNADEVYVDYVAEPTRASKRIDNGFLMTCEMDAGFLAVDSTGGHPDGPVKRWRNRVTLRHRLYTSSGGKRMLELRAAPNSDGKTEILYTTDGSDPRLTGGRYDEDVALPKSTTVVLALARRNDVDSEVLNVPINWDKPDTDTPIDPDKPATWRRRHDTKTTRDAYDLVDRILRHGARASGLGVSVIGERWCELRLQDLIELDGESLKGAAEAVRKILTDGQLGIEVGALHFEKGQGLLDWLNETKSELRPGEVQQK